MGFLPSKAGGYTVEHDHLLSFLSNVFCQNLGKESGKERLIKETSGAADDVPGIVDGPEHFTDGFSKQSRLLLRALLKIVPELTSATVSSTQFGVLGQQANLPHAVGHRLNDGLIE